MAKFLVSLLVCTFSLSVHADAAQGERLAKVSGESVLEDHYLNQYDDVNDPPQGYRVEIPEGYRLLYYATPDDGNGRKCSVTLDRPGRAILVEAHYLETDEPGCYAFLIFFNNISGRQKTVSYYITQTGT
jgi:hypothetical protein